ncbi:MAG: hypothetical protein JNL03_16210 [Prolixibacteraceae bacterium]|nr:hypothetical protein [Prolixibacteraceae bacterium]
MVRFEGNKMIIEYETSSPTEHWLNMVNELNDLLASQDKDMTQNRYWTHELLQQMMPDFDTAKMMITNGK